MKNLIVYYSRTGKNEKLANYLKEKLNCDAEKIISKDDFKGIFGYIRGGRDAMKKRVCEIESTKFNPQNYNLTIILAPLWAGVVPPPTRAYILQNKDNFTDVAFISVSGGGEFNKKAVSDFESQLNKKPVFTLLLKTREIKDDSYRKKLGEFLSSCLL